MSDQWKMFGEKIPRAEIVYFAQLLICLILIIACIVMLVLHDSNREYWMICLSSTVGYIMPSPTLQLKSPTNQNLHEKKSRDHFSILNMKCSTSH